MASKDNIIGLSIGLDTSSLRAGLQDAGRRIKEAGAEFKATTSNMDDWSKSSEGVQAKLKQLNTVLDVQKAVLERLQKEYDETYKGQDENSAAAVKLRTDILNQQAAIGKTNKDIGKFEKTLEELNTEQKDAQGELKDTNKVLKDQEDAAQKAGDGFTVMKGTLANLLADGINKLVDGLGKLKDAFFDSIAYADELLTTSSQTGVSVEKLQELQYASELVDVSLETVTGSMAKNIKSMTNYAKGSKDVVSVYDKLGVAVTNADGSLRNSEEVYWDLITALGEVENETERDSLAMTVLGKSAQDLNPLIQTGADKMAELAEEAHNTGYVMSDETVGALGEADDVVQRAKNSFTSFKNELIATLLSEVDLEKAQEFLNDAMTYLKDEVIPAVIDGFKWLKDHLPEIIATVSTIGATFAALKVASVVMGIVKAVKAWKLATEGMTIAQRIMNLVMAANPVGLIITLIVSLIGYIIYLWNTNDEFKEAIIKAWEAIKNFFIKMWDVIKKAFSDAWNWIKETWSKAGEFFGKLWTTIKEKFANVKSYFKEKFKEAWDSVKNVFSKVGSFFSGIWKTIKETFSDIGQKVGDAISSTFKAAVNGLLTAAEKILNAPIKAINKAIGILNELPKVNIKTLAEFELPRMAKGGIIDKATLGIVGEDGAEAVIPLERNLGWIKKLSTNIVSEMNKTSNNLSSSISNINNNKQFTQIINAPKTLPVDEMYRKAGSLLKMDKVVI